MPVSLPPVLHRDLLLAARHPRTFSIRAATAFVLALAGAGVAFADIGHIFGMANPLMTFRIMGSTVFAACLLGGLLLTLDSISAERREGTLGLLFLTPLTATDILLGKWAASCTRGLGALLGVLPILAIPLMMGSVAWPVFLGTAATLVATFVLSSGVGLWASTRSPSTASAFGLALLVLIPLAAVPFLAKFLADSTPAFRGTADPLLHASPVAVLSMGWRWDQPTPASALPRWLQPAGIACLGLIALADAARRLAGEFQQRPNRPSSAPAQTPGRPSPTAAAFHPDHPYASLYQRLLPRLSALNWLEGLCFAAFAGFALATVLTPVRHLGAPLFITTSLIAYALHVFYKIRVATAAALPWTDQLRNGTFELLVTTPLLTPARIFRERALALTQATAARRRILVLVNAILLGLMGVDSVGLDDPEVIISFASLFVAGVILLWTDTRHIVASTLLLSEQPRPTSTLLGRSLFPVLAPPWISALALFAGIAASPVRDWTVPLIFLVTQSVQCLVSFTLARRAERLAQHVFSASQP